MAGRARGIEERVTIEVALGRADPAAELSELRRALLESPRRIPTHYFYDRRGSELFEEITELPEYYLTERWCGAPPRSWQQPIRSSPSTGWWLTSTTTSTTSRPASRGWSSSSARLSATCGRRRRSKHQRQLHHRQRGRRPGAR